MYAAVMPSPGAFLKTTSASPGTYDAARAGGTNAAHRSAARRKFVFLAMPSIILFIKISLSSFPYRVFPRDTASERGGTEHGKAPSENEGAFILHLGRFCSMGRNPVFFGLPSSGSPPYSGGRAWRATELR